MGELLLLRHGETPWSRDLRHTGRTDVELTEHGRAQASAAAALLAPRRFAQVRVSPLQRARHTAELALPGVGTVVDEDLAEWDYGEVEGRTTADWTATHPDWVLWRDGCPGGESVADVAARAEAVLTRVAAPLATGDVLLVAHSHLLRVLAARYLDQPGSFGSRLVLDAGSVGVLGREHGNAAVTGWNVVAAGAAAGGAAEAVG